MFSIIFFALVAVILVAGFFAVTWRKKHKVPLEGNESTERYSRESVQQSNSAFNEPSTGDIKGGMVPTDNKLSQNDFDEENEPLK
jgi:hypothetical protein